jgi:hypothetical protein
MITRRGFIASVAAVPFAGICPTGRCNDFFKFQYEIKALTAHRGVSTKTIYVSPKISEYGVFTIKKMASDMPVFTKAMVSRRTYSLENRLIASRICWVDPVNGDNNNSGWNTKTAVADIETAFKKIEECENLERYI